MFSWVTSTLVQGEFGRKQTSQCSPAQSAQSVGGIALRYEIGCKPFTSLSGPYSASCPKVQILIHFSLENFCFCQTWKIQFVNWKQNDKYWHIKVLSLLETCFDLISGPSHHMKIQIMGRKMTENLGSKSLHQKVKIILSFFSFHFQILHKKQHIFVFNHFWAN